MKKQGAGKFVACHLDNEKIDSWTILVIEKIYKWNFVKTEN